MHFTLKGLNVWSKLSNKVVTILAIWDFSILAIWDLSEEELFVIRKLPDGLLFNNDGVVTSFGVLTKVISIGISMLSNNRLLKQAVSFCSMASITNDI